MDRTTFALMLVIIIILGATTVTSLNYINKIDKVDAAVLKPADSMRIYFGDKPEKGRQRMFVVSDSTLTTKYECCLELINDSIFKNNTYDLGGGKLKVKTYDRFVAVYEDSIMVKLIHFTMDNPKEGLRFKALD